MNTPAICKGIALHSRERKEASSPQRRSVTPALWSSYSDLTRVGHSDTETVSKSSDGFAIGYRPEDGQSSAHPLMSARRLVSSRPSMRCQCAEVNADAGAPRASNTKLKEADQKGQVLAGSVKRHSSSYPQLML